MEFDRELYPEEMRDRLEKAVRNSAENYLERKVKEESFECSECGKKDFKPVVKKNEGNYKEEVICNSCGNEREINVEIGDFKSSIHF